MPKPLILSLQYSHLKWNCYSLFFAHSPAPSTPSEAAFCLQPSAMEILPPCPPTADFLFCPSGLTPSFCPSSPRVQPHHHRAWTSSRFIRLASALLQIPLLIFVSLISEHTWPAEKQRKRRDRSGLPLTEILKFCFKYRYERETKAFYLCLKKSVAKFANSNLCSIEVCYLLQNAR